MNPQPEPSTPYTETVKEDITVMLHNREPVTHLAAYMYGLLEETSVRDEVRAEGVAAITAALLDYRKTVLRAERMLNDLQVGDAVVIRECPLGRHVGVTGTVTARDDLWLRVQIEGGAFCEPSQVEVALPVSDA